MRSSEAAGRVALANVALQAVSSKGVLGPSIGRNGTRTLAASAARAAGIIVDSNGRLRCPPTAGGAAGEFTDMQLSNCPVSVLKDVAQGTVRQLALTPKRMARLRRLSPRYRPTRKTDRPDGAPGITDEPGGRANAARYWGDRLQEGIPIEGVPDESLWDAILYTNGSEWAKIRNGYVEIVEDVYEGFDNPRFSITQLTEETDSPTGVNDTFFVLDNKTNKKYFVKQDSSADNGAYAEILSNEIAHELGLPVGEFRLANGGTTPDTVLTMQSHVGEFVNGGLIRPVHDDDDIYDPIATFGNPIHHDPNNLATLIMFDWVTANPDRHGGNMFLTQDVEGKAHIVPIDHGWSFQKGQDVQVDKFSPIKWFLHDPSDGREMFSSGIGFALAEQETYGFETRDSLLDALESARERLLNIDIDDLDDKVIETFPDDYELPDGYDFAHNREMFKRRIRALQDVTRKDFSRMLDKMQSGEATKDGPQQVARPVEFHSPDVVVPHDASYIDMPEDVHGLMQPNGLTVRGVPLAHDDDTVPDKLFHVTTLPEDAGRSSGRLEPNSDGVFVGWVGFVESEDAANRRLRDLEVYSDVSRAWRDDDFDAMYAALTKHTGGEFDTVTEAKAADYWDADNPLEMLSIHFRNREIFAEQPPPQLPNSRDEFDTSADWDPPAIVTVRKETLNDRALLTETSTGLHLYGATDGGSVRRNPFKARNVEEEELSPEAQEADRAIRQLLNGLVQTPSAYLNRGSDADAPEPTPVSKRVDAEGQPLNVTVPDNPSFHNVTREDELGFGNPAYGEAQQAWRSNGQTLRGEPISPTDDRINDTLYHVSPAASEIIESGTLRARGDGGLGGDSNDRIVSLTNDRETAEQLLSDMMFTARYAQRTRDGDNSAARQIMQDDARRHGFDPDSVPTIEDIARDRESALSLYYNNRQTQAGVTNPVVFGSLEKFEQVSPEDIAMVEVPKENLDNGAAVVNFDLGRPGGLNEIRVYGDINIRTEFRDDRLLADGVADEPIRRPMIIDTPKDLDSIQDTFTANNRKLMLVGGAVRDVLMGKEPKDYDLATDAPPDEVIAMLEDVPGVRIDLTGKDFAVVRVKTPDGNEYEIATFRSDVGEGRRPEGVELTTIDEDVARRDLTMNALFYDLERREVVDYVGGIEDIENGVVRAVGDPAARFREDKLRILRALRFSGRTGFDLDEATKDAIRNDPDLTDVSPERIRDEFVNGLTTAQDPKAFVQLVTDLELWPQILQVDDGVDLVVDPAFSIDTDNHALQMAALLQGNDSDRVETVLKNLRYKNDEIADIKFIQKFGRITPDTAPDLKREFRDRKVGEGDLAAYARTMGMDDNAARAFVEFANSPQAVDAQDLIDQGLKGPAIGEAIRAAETNAYRRILERNNVKIDPAPTRNWTRNRTGKIYEGGPVDSFFSVLGQSRYSGYKAHVFSTTHEEIDEVLDRIYDVAEARGWAVKTATDGFFNEVTDGHSQHGKGVTVYFPNAVNWESEAKELAFLMKGYSPSGNIRGDDMITDSIGMRYDFAVDPGDSSVDIRDVKKFYLSANAPETDHSKKKRKQIREFSGRLEIESILDDT